MSDVKTWSTTDASNTDTAKSGMPEGMARSDVNNRAREHMGALRRWYEDAEWVDLVSGHGGDFTLSRVNTTTFRVTDVVSGGTNASSKFPAGAWAKVTIGGTDYFGSITSSTYSNPNTDVVLGEIVNAAYATATLPVGSVTLAATYIARRVRSAAFSQTGTTSSQTPPHVPTIDDLQGHVLKPEGHTGDDSGINADRLDDQHASYFTDRDGDPHENVLSNATFTTWSRGTPITGSSTNTNADGNLVADDWFLLSDGSDHFDVSRFDAGNADGLKEFVYGLRMTGVNTTASPNSEMGGVVQIIDATKARPIVRNGKCSLSFYARSTAGDSIGRVRAAVLYTTASDQVTDIVGTWPAEGVTPTWASGWNLAGITGVHTLATTWQRFSLPDATIPATAIDMAFFVWIDDTGYNATDEFNLAGVQLEPGAEVTPFRQVADSELSFVSPSLLANYDGGPVAHGLGRVPRFVSTFVRVKAGQSGQGYTAGQVAYLGLVGTSYGNRGLTVGADATNIWWSLGNGNLPTTNGAIVIIERDLAGTNVGAFINDDVTWELVIQAWK